MPIKLIVLFFLIAPWAARAEMNCSSDETAYNINIPNIMVPANSLPGNILAMAPHSVHVTCAGTGNFQQVAGVGNGDWSSSGLTANVDGLSCAVIDQGTAISAMGLGIVWTNYNSASGTWACFSGVFNGSATVSPQRRGLQSNGTTTLTDKFYIVRTNTEPGYGETALIDQLIYIDEADSDRVSRGHLYQIGFSGSMYIEAGGCSVDSVINVNMGTVSSDSFRKQGDTGPNVPFNLTLKNCFGSAATALVSLEPTYGYADEANGVIALSSETGSAQGIGIQLLMNGMKPDPGGNNKYPLQPGTTNIPFVARYFQYLSDIKSGNADSSVLFYITYE